ncbi:hypothetical protein N202_02140 [Helicobacter pylori UM067]|nr:hypothetical protein N202_02140 [Helicobacter pylori UM067]
MIKCKNTKKRFLPSMTKNLQKASDNFLKKAVLVFLQIRL